jgi:hypothetical protein
MNLNLAILNDKKRAIAHRHSGARDLIVTLELRVTAEGSGESVSMQLQREARRRTVDPVVGAIRERLQASRTFLAAKEMHAEVEKTSHELDILAAQVAELEARRKTITLGPAKQMAERLATIDGELSRARAKKSHTEGSLKTLQSVLAERRTAAEQELQTAAGHALVEIREKLLAERQEAGRALAEANDVLTTLLATEWAYRTSFNEHVGPNTTDGLLDKLINEGGEVRQAVLEPVEAS